MKVPVVMATGAGVVITGGLVLIVPAINKDIAYIDKMITNAHRDLQNSKVITKCLYFVLNSLLQKCRVFSVIKSYSNCLQRCSYGKRVHLSGNIHYVNLV